MRLRPPLIYKAVAGPLLLLYRWKDQAPRLDLHSQHQKTLVIHHPGHQGNNQHQQLPGVRQVRYSWPDRGLTAPVSVIEYHLRLGLHRRHRSLPSHHPPPSRLRNHCLRGQFPSLGRHSDCPRLYPHFPPGSDCHPKGLPF